jgi:chromatin remodeling complex protein RSC6
MAKSNSAFMKPKNVSPELEAVVGKGPMPTTEAVSKIWVYIKKHNLQDPKDRRQINADENLKKVFGGKDKIGMMQIGGFISKHLS